MSVAEKIIESAEPKAAPALALVEGQEPGAAPGAEALEQTHQKTLSPELTILAKKEKALVDKQRAFAQKQEEWKQEQEALRKQIDEFKSKESRWKESPEKALEEYGHSYQTLTERMLSGGELTPQEALKRAQEEIKALRDGLDSDKKKQAEEAELAQKQHAERAISEYKETLKNFIGEKKDEYKLTSLFDENAELIYDTIDAYFVKHQKVLDHNEAAGLVESYLKGLVDKANGAITPKEAPKPKAEKPEDGFMGLRDHSKPAPSSTTLTNSLNEAAPLHVQATTEQERIKRALAALDKKK